jgi:hypothetical protein
LHPYRGADVNDYATEERSKYEIWWTFGWPYETSAAMARLVFAGLFDRFPAMKIITHHMGAMAPYFEGRVGPGWDQLGVRTSDEDYSNVLRRLKKRPLDYFRMFYADTAEPRTCFSRPMRHSIPNAARCTSAKPSASSTACRFQTRIVSESIGATRYGC